MLAVRWCQAQVNEESLARKAETSTTLFMSVREQICLFAILNLKSKSIFRTEYLYIELKLQHFNNPFSPLNFSVLKVGIKNLSLEKKNHRINFANMKIKLADLL